MGVCEQGGGFGDAADKGFQGGEWEEWGFEWGYWVGDGGGGGGVVSGGDG